MTKQNVVRLPRRRRRAPGAPIEAKILAFPDRLGIHPPAFDPDNPAHVRGFETMWMFGRLELAKTLAVDHPLRRALDQMRREAGR